MDRGVLIGASTRSNAPSQHCSMFANTHQILYTSTGRPAYPPGAPVCGLPWGPGVPTSHGPACALRHMRARVASPVPTPLLRTNTASRRPGFVRRFRPMIRFLRGGDSVRADRPDHSITATKEVTMFKRVTIVALVVAAFLVLAVPALAFNGMRGRLHRQQRTAPVCHRPVSGLGAQGVRRLGGDEAR